MGMFDYIKCKVELPNGKRNVLDQTKEFDCLLLRHEIDSLGQLWLDHSDALDDELVKKLVKNNDFSGSIEIDDYSLNFYRGQLDEFESNLDGELTRFRKPTYEDLHAEVDRLRLLIEGYDELRKKMKQPTEMPQWLHKQFENAERTVQTWSEGKREAAGIPSCDYIKVSDCE